ncbi:hypothetical protein I601_3565 [Nocardioides dokdonensis FR1436]|uniref:WD40-like Beta Propeller Repeat protein n=1 Tax=Nocardioides dokdonensis FR1436 TaxID=1300347 RepID=A0A1A9GR69_9ACTN|nr:hypothetical protein [Nocardioides dokdonensis]ANH39971.1 hypothetical protein I601_3565 [Nocardioides dokdonensis FR1436]
MSESTDLQRRLDALAERAVREAGPARPDDAWSRGRAWQRRRRHVTSAVVGVAVLVVLVVGAGGWRLTAPGPSPAPAPAAPSSDGPRLPDRLYEFDGWRPRPADDPPGVLSAVLGGSREGWWGSGGMGIVGVASASGEYRYLALPGRVEALDVFENDVALSADGRWIAYWLGGEPIVSADETTDDEVVGVAMQDLTTGEVVRHAVPTEHGLVPEELVWAGTTLWFSHFQRTGPGETSGTDGLTASWEVGAEEPRTWEGRAIPTLYDATSAGDLLVSVAGRTVELLRPGSRQVLELDTLTEGPGVLSPSGTRLAVTLDPDGPRRSDTTARTVAVGDVEAGRPVELSPVGDSNAHQVLGWRDDDHVVVDVRGDGPSGSAYVSLDVTTGEATPLVTPEPQNLAPGTLVAQEAWAGELFDAPAPPTARDPRLGWALLVGVPLALLAGLLLWRRRAQP